jgi:hypothetical protein
MSNRTATIKRLERDYTPPRPLPRSIAVALRGPHLDALELYLARRERVAMARQVQLNAFEARYGQ